jgi:hypothetical protein
MGEVVPITQPLTADDKRRLIQAAHDQLVSAKEIDERETLADSDAFAWYDEVLPHVVDIEMIARALYLELSIRQGELIGEEGEQRGGDVKSLDAKNQSVAVPHFDNAEKISRKENRLLASEKSAVRAYARNAIQQGKAPTRRGALRVAHLSKGSRSPVTKQKQVKKKHSTPHAVSGLYQAFDKLMAEDRPLSDSEIHALTSMSSDYLRMVSAYIPWLRRTKTTAGTHFSVDQELREICEGKRPRPQLNGASLAQELRMLRSEIDRRRKERDLYIRKTNWDHLTSHAKFIIELMNWIERELERVATLL